MPRLIPRLLQSLKGKAIDVSEPTTPLRPPSKGSKSLYRPVPPTPQFSPAGRSQSLLLDPLNPIIHPRSYLPHKQLPPVVRLHKNQRTRAVSRDGTIEHDKPRTMTARGEGVVGQSIPYVLVSVSTFPHLIYYHSSTDAIWSIAEMFCNVAKAAHRYELLPLP